MNKPLRILAQAGAYALFAAVVGYFSMSPTYTHHDPSLALIRLSFSHAAGHREPCRQLTPEEIAALAPNMRLSQKCSRERLDVFVELALDDDVLYRAALPPSGLARDGASTAYQRFAVAPGSHRLRLRLRDSARKEGYDYEHEADIELAPSENFVVDFRANLGGFVFL